MCKVKKRNYNDNIKFKEEFNMKKRMIGLLLAATMIIGSSVTAFASDATGMDNTTISNNAVTANSAGGDVEKSGGTIEWAGKVREATIKITVTTAKKVILNPYHLNVFVTGNDGAEGGDVSTGVVAAPINFKNEGEVPMAITITGKITVSGANNTSLKGKVATIAATPAAVKAATTKQIYVQGKFEVSGGDVTGTNLYYAVPAKTAGAEPTWTPAKELVYTATGAVTPQPAMLAAKGTQKTGVSENDEINWIVTGETSIDPKVEWTSEDDIKVITIYDLKAVPTSTALSRFY